MKLLVNILLVNAISFAHSGSPSENTFFLKGPTSKSTIYGVDGSQLITIQEAGQITPNGNVGPTFRSYLIDANGKIIEPKNGELPSSKNCDNGASCKKDQNLVSFESNSIIPDSFVITNGDNTGAASYNQPNYVPNDSLGESTKNCHTCATVDANNLSRSEGFNVNITGPKSSSIIKGTFTEGTVSTGSYASSNGIRKSYGKSEENSAGVNIIGPSSISVIKHSFDENDKHQYGSSNGNIRGPYSESAAGSFSSSQGYQESGSFASGTSIRENYDENKPDSNKNLFAAKQGSKPSSTNIIGPSSLGVIGTSVYASKGYHESVNSHKGPSSFDLKSTEIQPESSSVNIQGPKFSVFGTPPSTSLRYHTSSSSSNLSIQKENQPQSSSVNVQGPTSTIYQGYNPSLSHLSVSKENQGKSSNIQGSKFSAFETSSSITQRHHPSSPNVNIPKSNQQQLPSINIHESTSSATTKGYHLSSSNLNIRKENQSQSSVKIQGATSNENQGRQPSWLNLNTLNQSNFEKGEDANRPSTLSITGPSFSSIIKTSVPPNQVQHQSNSEYHESNVFTSYSGEPKSVYKNGDANQDYNLNSNKFNRPSSPDSTSTQRTYASSLNQYQSHQNLHPNEFGPSVAGAESFSRGSVRGSYENNGKIPEQNHGQSTPSPAEQHGTEFHKSIVAFGGKDYQSTSDLRNSQSLNHYDNQQNQFPKHLNSKKSEASDFGVASFSNRHVIATYNDNGKFPEQNFGQSSSAQNQFSASTIDFTAQSPSHNQESDSVIPSTSSEFGGDANKSIFSGNRKFTASSVSYSKDHNSQQPCASNNCDSVSNSIGFSSSLGHRNPKFLNSNNVNRQESSSFAPPTFSNTDYESNIKGSTPVNLADCYYFVLPTYANIAPGDYAISFKKVPHVQHLT